MSAPALRPFLPADTPILAAIFVASIEGLTGDDYGEAQQEAWAAAVDDEVEFGKRLASGLTLVATLDGSPVGRLRFSRQCFKRPPAPSASCRSGCAK